MDKQFHKVSHICHDTFMSDKVKYLLHTLGGQIDRFYYKVPQSIQTGIEHKNILKTVTLDHSTQKTIEIQQIFIIRKIDEKLIVKK